MKMKTRKHNKVQDVWNGPLFSKEFGKYVVRRRFGKKKTHLKKPKEW